MDNPVSITDGVITVAEGCVFIRGPSQYEIGDGDIYAIFPVNMIEYMMIQEI